jgi:hypothetical protein
MEVKTLRRSGPICYFSPPSVSGHLLRAVLRGAAFRRGYPAEARTTNGQWSVVAPLDGGKRFFRLRLR